jgi:8-oxo-dGTP pyrophosphatase MutT (NUDIX family)
VVREFSAGGLAIRRLDGEAYLACVRVKGGKVLALPKGHLEPGETASQAAVREVREETGIEAAIVDSLGRVEYWYVREGHRVLKSVEFFLLDYLSGSLANHDYEVWSAEWIPLDQASNRLRYRGEQDMAKTALTRINCDQ